MVTENLTMPFWAAELPLQQRRINILLGTIRKRSNWVLESSKQQVLLSICFKTLK